MKLGNTAITFEEDSERLKVVIPLQRHVAAAAIYTVLAAAWLVGLIFFLYLLFFPPSPRGIDALPGLLRAVWILGVLLWLFVWVRYLGRMILRWWQFHLATREVLLVNKDAVIVRRPVSVFGLTDAYDRRYMTPFYYNDTHNCLAFQYGKVRHILVGLTVARPDNLSLLAFLNRRLFPNMVDEDDED